MEEEITAAVVACGTDHTATISRRGQLFTWGLGNSGELGHDDLTFLDTPFPLRAYLFQHEHIRIVSVACGGNHTLAIAENGTLWSCGRNKSGQLGHGTVLDSTGLMRVINLPRCALFCVCVCVHACMCCYCAQCMRLHAKWHCVLMPRCGPLPHAGVLASSLLVLARCTPWRWRLMVPFLPGATHAMGSWATCTCRATCPTTTPFSAGRSRSPV